MRRLPVVRHLSVGRAEAEYRACKHPTEKVRWHAIWLFLRTDPLVPQRGGRAMTAPANSRRALTVDVLTSAGTVVLGFALMGVFLLLTGRDPIQTFSGLIKGGFGTRFGFHETLVAAAPVMQCAVAVAPRGSGF